MPKGYKCDKCGEFDRYEHRATKINWQEVTYEDGRDGSTDKILCPDCGQEVWELVTGSTPPEGME